MAALSTSLQMNVCTGPASRNCGTRSRKTVSTQPTEWESLTRRAEAVKSRIGSSIVSEVVMMVKRLSGLAVGLVGLPSFSISVASQLTTFRQH
jgi:hypothetical protein